ncbi:phosphate starvation-inducible protein PsiF [Cupriavidus gilardii]|uniref:PsiF family protein n=1 Tax=Cupriavidus gilardii TaxID=82541 RepID=UPI001ABE391E|nr:PsiF family protein [Cupriavidus gilardii]MBO4119396.1 phosphate starvation-inducible protein PsiF [Cupriavidus gilardii]
MKSLIATCVLLCPLVATGAFAQTASENSQQSKMKTCNAQAAGKTGDERKAFMKECLSAKPAAAGNAQQQKMKACNAQASGKKGDERKAFMKECLSA